MKIIVIANYNMIDEAAAPALLGRSHFPLMPEVPYSNKLIRLTSRNLQFDV